MSAPETPAGGRVEPSTDLAREAGRNDLSAQSGATERLRLAADELDRDGRWGAARDATTALAAWMRAEADRPTRDTWDDHVLRHAADLADHILGEATR